MSLEIPLDSAVPTTARLRTSAIIATLGVAWNLFGAVQFLQTLGSTPQSLMDMGMSAEQAFVYTSYPAWMNAGFGLGVFGGLLGSALLLARRRSAVPVLAASLAGYLVLYAGDITEGVFAALGAPQIAILTLVVAIAAGLFVWARWLDRRDLLG
jgi:hypothetical protein